MTSDEKGQRSFSLVESDGDDSAFSGVDFSTFVLSLATSALYHLGMVSDPQGGTSKKQNIEDSDLALARQTIDTLEMIATKTQGNLETDEARLLESILYDLHMQYVEARK